MAKLFRRIDIADRDFLSRSVKRAVAQADRQAGDGGIGAAAAWGSITGTLSNQTDLSQELKDKEILNAFMDD